MEKKQVKIALVDDHVLFAQGLQSMLTSCGYVVVGVGANVEQGYCLVKNNAVDIVFCDVQMPKEGGGILVERLRAEFPRVRIAMLSMCEDAATIREMLDLGIDAYLVKSSTIDTIQRAIAYILEGKRYISEEIASILMEKTESKSSRALLTAREKEILRLMLNELANKEIADKLFISERTVEAHRRNIYRKTNTSSIIGLMKWSVEHNVIDLH
ncbi:MAG: response regulator transcription factor [Bacteroidales bacterium]|nr:response regulator transcription factor [Bacteroidales bacterium]MBN2750224.1 response regulator transcription factor [Bacteroidales bacterium]